MQKDTIELRILRADAGKQLEKDGVTAQVVYLAVNADESEWKEVDAPNSPEAEGDE